MLQDLFLDQGLPSMKVLYDRETDSLVITLREAPIQESDEVRPG
jgi:hypothetical protein